MAQDINEQVSNMFNAAKQALNDDLKQNFYNAAISRQNAFRQLNNNANTKHALYSGLPAATQMAYDRETFLPGTASMAQRALAKQKENQDAWDEYMEYIDKLNEQANYYNGLADEIKSKYADYGYYPES